MYSTQPQQQAGGGSFQQQINKGITIAKFISDPLLGLVRADMGCYSVNPMTLFAVPAGLWLLGGFHPTPLTEVLATGAFMGWRQTKKSYANLQAGILHQPYERGRSRLAPWLEKIVDDHGKPYLSPSFIQHWAEPLAISVAGYGLMKLRVGGGLGPYMAVGGVCIRALEHLGQLKSKEKFVNAAAAYADAQDQAAIAQHFQNPPAAPLPQSKQAVTGLSTGIGNDLKGKVEELKAQEEKEKKKDRFE